MLEIIGAIFVILVGSLFHFLYILTNNNKIIGYFTAVNESTWEHIKLIIGPSFLWLIVEYHFYFFNNNLFFAKFVGMLVMISMILILFYTYTFFTRKNYLIIDISIFILSVLSGQYIFSLLLNMMNFNNLINHIGIFGLIIIFLKYLTRTYVPKKNFLFKDPITGKYGINNHF